MNKSFWRITLKKMVRKPWNGWVFENNPSPLTGGPMAEAVFAYFNKKRYPENQHFFESAFSVYSTSVGGGLPPISVFSSGTLKWMDHLAGWL